MKALRVIKRIVSIFTCMVLVYTCSNASFAKSADDGFQSVIKVDAEYPIIIVQGIKFDQQYVNEGTQDEFGYLDSLNVQSVLGAVTSSAFKGIFTFNMDNFMNGIIDYCNDAFKYISCDKNGNSAYNVGAHKYTQSMAHYDNYPSGTINEEGILKTAIDRYGADMCYYFSYDWRADPLDNNDEINALIEQAKSDHNSDKVNIISASLGGANVLAYLYEYGYASVNNCVFLSTTIYGTYVASDLFKGDIDFSADVVFNYISAMLETSPVAKFSVKVMYKSGLLGGVCSLLSDIVDRYGDRIYDEILRDTFATIPSLWAVVLPEDYDECINYMFPTDELKQEYSGLISRAEALQKMMSERDTLLEKAKSGGMKVSIVAGYNLPVIPAYKRASTQGDSILETALMAGNATVADYGKTLGDNYKAVNPELVSPDNIVDMSTAKMPDCTWVVRDAPHVACLYGSEFSDFVFALAEAKEQPDVKTFSGYQRFMCVDKVQNFIEF